MRKIPKNFASESKLSFIMRARSARHPKHKSVGTTLVLLRFYAECAVCVRCVCAVVWPRHAAFIVRTNRTAFICNELTSVCQRDIPAKSTKRETAKQSETRNKTQTQKRLVESGSRSGIGIEPIRNNISIFVHFETRKKKFQLLLSICHRFFATAAKMQV